MLTNCGQGREHFGSVLGARRYFHFATGLKHGQASTTSVTKFGFENAKRRLLHVPRGVEGRDGLDAKQESGLRIANPDEGLTDPQLHTGDASQAAKLDAPDAETMQDHSFFDATEATPVRNAVDDELEEVAREFCDDVETHKEVVRRKHPEYPPFVRETIRKVREVLRKLGEPAAVKDLHAFLTKMEENNPTRFKVYEAAIRMFLREGYPMAAVTCYTRMTAEGFLCPISLRAQMAVISLVNRSPEPEEFFALLEKWFKNERFNERAFQDMLFLIDDVISQDPDFIDTVAKLYLQCKHDVSAFSRETLSWIVYIHARAGSKKAAKDWLESDQPEAERSAEPYVSLLRFIGDSSEDEELSRWVVQRMRDLGITPNLSFYTALLTAQCAQKRYDSAFQIYAALRASADPALLPNKFIFAQLFHAHREMYQPRSLRTRTIERPRAAPSPRQLFRDMVLCHTARTEHGLEGTLAGPSLIAALRVFLWRRDYAGAYVTLKMVRVCKLPINLEMYQRVLAPILRRLKQELPLLGVEEDSRSSWTYRFLGLSSAPNRQRPTYGTPVLDMVLRIGMVPRLSLSYIAPKLSAASSTPPGGPLRSDVQAGSPNMSGELDSSQLPGQPDDDAVQDFRGNEMPSTLEVAGVERVNPFNVYSAVPLERILRRAILAGRPPSSAAPMKDVVYEIAMANEQMGKNLKIKRR